MMRQLLYILYAVADVTTGSTALCVTFAILLLAAVAIILLLCHRIRVIRQKNRSLVRQISEAMEYKEKYLESKKLLAELSDKAGQYHFRLSQSDYY